MIPKPSGAHLMIEFRFTGMRSRSAHRPDGRHFLTGLPITIASLFPRVDIPLDNIHGCSYAFSVEPDRGTRAIPIGAEADSRP
jgi:hypothetical protein